MRLATTLLLVLLATTRAWSDTNPIIDEDRSHGPVAHHVIEVSAGNEWLSGPTANDDLGVFSLQLGAGPTKLGGRLWEIGGELNKWSIFGRLTHIDLDQNPPGSVDGWGPTTLALTRYAPVGPLDFAPMVYIHTGFEVAVGTPWLSDSTRTPPMTLQTTNLAPDLQFNGWAFRPFSPYVRVDLLVCRSIYFEFATAPEVIHSTAEDRANQYFLRSHAAFGISPACKDRRDSALHHVAASIVYATHARLYAADASPTYLQNLALNLQIDLGRVVLIGFAAIDPERSPADYRAFGVRLQLGFLGGSK
jgi:hypothetical protein